MTQVKTDDSDGYGAVQLGFEESRKLNSPSRGHLGKAGTPMLRHLREWRVPDPAEYELGQRLDVSMFEPGERVTLVGTSKGKGFQGVVKRHGFAGGPKTHGQSDRWRAPGSIGSGTTPGEVRIKKDLDLAIRGKDVLLIEDIVDTGWTLRTILDLLRFRGARSVKLCALLDKAAAREAEVQIDYKGFEIEPLFVVGYGLDFDEKYRNLPYIAVLDEEPGGVPSPS